MAYLRYEIRMLTTAIDQLSDEQLVLCAARTTRCVETFLARYEEKDPRLRLADGRHPNEIEDLAQETVLRLLRSLPSFKGEASAATWVYRIAHNTCVDAHRRPAARPQTASLELGDEADAE